MLPTTNTINDADISLMKFFLLYINRNIDKTMKRLVKLAVDVASINAMAVIPERIDISL